MVLGTYCTTHSELDGNLVGTHWETQQKTLKFKPSHHSPLDPLRGKKTLSLLTCCLVSFGSQV